MHAAKKRNLMNKLTGVFSVGAILCGSFFLSQSCKAQQVDQPGTVTVIPDRVETKMTKKEPIKKVKPQKFYSYTEAYKLSKKENKPFVVIVTATWCPPCQAMKNTSIPELKKNGGLDGVIVALVDVDKEKVLASQLTQGSSIPYVVVFEKKGKNWDRRAVAGYQSPLALKSFIKPAKAMKTAAVEKIIR